MSTTFGYSILMFDYDFMQSWDGMGGDGGWLLLGKKLQCLSTLQSTQPEGRQRGQEMKIQFIQFDNYISIFQFSQFSWKIRLLQFVLLKWN